MKRLNALDIITTLAWIAVIALMVCVIAQHKKEVANLKQEAKNIQTEYDKLEREKLNKETEYEKRINTLKSKIDSLNDEITSLQEQLKEVHTDNEHLRLELDTVSIEQYVEPVTEMSNEVNETLVSGIEIVKDEYGSITNYVDNTVVKESETKLYAGHYELTAYIETGNPCADGVYPQTGYTVACNDPNLWHKWIEIEGYGRYYVHDTGGMASNVIDIYVGDYDTAIQFGRQSADVYVIE